ncbi:MAG: hypothetical protein WB565_03790 [Acidimicrobiales bacterium]
MSEPLLLEGKRHPGRGGKAWERVRRQVLTSSQVCWRCGGDIDLTIDARSPWSATVDHLVELRSIRSYPAAEQRRLALDPALLRPAHRICNSKRSAGGTTRQPAPSPRSREW